VIEYPASAFDIENVHLKFTRGALHAIAREALKRKSGARGGAVLRTVPPFNGEPTAIPQVQNLSTFVRISSVIIRHYLGFGYLGNKKPLKPVPI
jgi:ATP-dependent protease Clp ATPase subunit